MSDNTTPSEPEQSGTPQRDQMISSLLWKTIERGGNQLLLIVVQLVLARLLAPTDFGAMAIILVFSTVGLILVQSGLNFSLIQSREVSDDDYSTVFWMSLGVSVTFYTFVFFLAPYVADFYHLPALVWPLRIMMLSLFLNAYTSVPMAILTREFRFRSISTTTLIGVFVSGVLGVGSALLGYGLWALVVQQLSYQVATVLVFIVTVRWMPKLRFRVALARKHYAFGWRLLVSGLVNAAYESSFDLIVGKRFSLAELGMASQGKRYASAVGAILNGVIQPVMLATVSRAQDDRAYIKRMVKRAIKASAFIVVPAMVLFAIVAEPLIRILLGEKWLAAVPFFQIYCLINIFLPLQSISLQALNGVGRSDLFLRYELIKRGLGLAMLMFTAFYLNNILIIVLGYLLVEIIAAIIDAVPNQKLLGYSLTEQFRDVVPAFALTALAGTAAWSVSFIAMPSLALIITQGVVMLAVYFALAWAFRVETFQYLLTTAKGFIAARRGTA